jgi:hypothetical protein
MSKRERVDLMDEYDETRYHVHKLAGTGRGSIITPMNEKGKTPLGGIMGITPPVGMPEEPAEPRREGLLVNSKFQIILTVPGENSENHTE